MWEIEYGSDYFVIENFHHILKCIYGKLLCYTTLCEKKIISHSHREQFWWYIIQIWYIILQSLKISSIVKIIRKHISFIHNELKSFTIALIYSNHACLSSPHIQLTAHPIFTHIKRAWLTSELSYMFVIYTSCGLFSWNMRPRVPDALWILIFLRCINNTLIWIPNTHIQLVIYTYNILWYIMHCTFIRTTW